jgi:hypothetical protein
MARPKGDLGDLMMPKDAASVAAHGSAEPPATPAGKAYAHTLSLRLTAEQYRRLRRYVAGVEDRTGSRLTHQSVIETALGEYLERNGG